CALSILHPYDVQTGVLENVDQVPRLGRAVLNQKDTGHREPPRRVPAKARATTDVPDSQITDAKGALAASLEEKNPHAGHRQPDRSEWENRRRYPVFSVRGISSQNSSYRAGSDVPGAPRKPANFLLTARFFFWMIPVHAKFT